MIQVEWAAPDYLEGCAELRGRERERQYGIARVILLLRRTSIYRSID